MFTSVWKVVVSWRSLHHDASRNDIKCGSTSISNRKRSLVFNAM